MAWAGEQKGGFGFLRAIDLATFNTREHFAMEELATHTEALTSSSLETCETTLKVGASKVETRVVSFIKSGLPGTRTDPWADSEDFKQSTSSSLPLANETAQELGVKAKSAKVELERGKCIATDPNNFKSCTSTSSAETETVKADHEILSSNHLFPCPCP